MPEQKTHTGGCHCGKFRYRVETDLSQVIRCNCSICSKKGAVLTFAPASAFHLEKGTVEEATESTFNKKVIRHLFCPACGVQSFALGKAPDGTEMAAINVLCLDGVDVGSLTVTPFDGANM